MVGRLTAKDAVDSPDSPREAAVQDRQATGTSIGFQMPTVLQEKECLIEMYLRSSQFRDCIRVMLEAGAVIADPVLQAVLLDDVKMLRKLMKEPRFITDGRYDLDCTFTPSDGRAGCQSGR